MVKPHKKGAVAVGPGNKLRVQKNRRFQATRATSHEGKDSGLFIRDMEKIMEVLLNDKDWHPYRYRKCCAHSHHALTEFWK